MELYKLRKGERGRVSCVRVDGAAGERLRVLGVREGATVQVLALSLFNSSVLVSCGYVRLAVRRSVARRIEVERA